MQVGRQRETQKNRQTERHNEAKSDFFNFVNTPKNEITKQAHYAYMVSELSLRKMAE